MTRFEVGKSYYMRSACDHECVWTFKVVARTAQTVTLENNRGEVSKCRISRQDAFQEAVYPLGRYSCCPILRAERVC